jgi:uncharacterized membrane protein HdeD (DUF308 family)
LILTWLIGAYAIVFGVIFIILAIQFRTAVSLPQAWRQSSFLWALYAVLRT